MDKLNKGKKKNQYLFVDFCIFLTDNLGLHAKWRYISLEKHDSRPKYCKVVSYNKCLLLYLKLNSLTSMLLF